MKRILAVDDDADILALEERILSKMGYQVVCVTDGGAAIRLLQEERFDLVLLDVMMPEVNGFEVSRTLRTSGKGTQIPVIFVTAKDDVASMQEGFRAGGTVFLSKPFTASQLIGVVKIITGQ